MEVFVRYDLFVVRNHTNEGMCRCFDSASLMNINEALEVEKISGICRDKSSV